MKRYYDEIVKEIDNLKKGKHIFIVEGKKDKNSLMKIGFNDKDIYVLNKIGVSLYQMVENLINKVVKNERCVILTDLDKKGKKLYFILKNELQKKGIKTNNQLRDLLIKENISHIEGLATYLENDNHN